MPVIKLQKHKKAPDTIAVLLYHMQLIEFRFPKDFFLSIYVIRVHL